MPTDASFEWCFITSTLALRCRWGASTHSNGSALIDDIFHPVSDRAAAQSLYCLSIPFLVGRHPFVQGITSAYDMVEVVGADRARSPRQDQPSSSAPVPELVE